GVVVGVVFGAQGIGTAQPGGVQRVVDEKTQPVGVGAQRHQAAESSFAVGGGGVEQDARHLFLPTSRVHLLGDAGGTVTSFQGELPKEDVGEDRKSTRLNSSHVSISYAVFCLKKKTKEVDEASAPANRTTASRVQ